MEEKTNSKNKTKFILIVTVCFVLIFLIVRSLLSPTTDEALKKDIAELNKPCPQMLDAYTRLDSVTGPAPLTIQYNYTLLYATKDDITPDRIKVSEEEVINAVKSSIPMKPLKDRDITFIYNYYDKNSDFIYKFPVTPDIYKKP